MPPSAEPPAFHPLPARGSPRGRRAGGPGHTHVAGSRCRGGRLRTHTRPRQGRKPGSCWDTGTSAHSSPQRCRAGRLGCRPGVSPAQPQNGYCPRATTPAPLVVGGLEAQPRGTHGLSSRLHLEGRATHYLGPTQLGHLPCSQPGPVKPGGQRHSPVTWWQAVSGGHRQRWAQASPNQPCGQAAGRRGLGCGALGPVQAWRASRLKDPPPGAGGAGGSLVSHRKPLHPGGQRQAPVTRWQVAPHQQTQRSSQQAPNVPSAQAAGRDGERVGPPASSLSSGVKTLSRGALGRPNSSPTPTGHLTTLLRTHTWNGAEAAPAGPVGPLSPPHRPPTHPTHSSDTCPPSSQRGRGSCPCTSHRGRH